MRQLPQQMLDNLTPQEWLDHAYRERIIPECIEGTIEDEVRDQLIQYEAELLEDVQEDFVAEYDRGYDQGREDTIGVIRESLNRC